MENHLQSLVAADGGELHAIDEMFDVSMAPAAFGLCLLAERGICCANGGGDDILAGRLKPKNRWHTIYSGFEWTSVSSSME
jgi:hypothetical protein